VSAWHSVKCSWQRKREGTVPSSVSEGGKENVLEGGNIHWEIDAMLAERETRQY